MGANGKRLLYLGGVVVLSLLLSSCQLVDGKKIAEEEQKDMLRLSIETMDGYYANKAKAESKQDKVREAVFLGEDDILSESCEVTGNYDDSVDYEHFKTVTVIDDAYYTALGASTLKQVVVYKGTGKRLMATMYWSDGEIISMDRTVVEER